MCREKIALLLTRMNLHGSFLGTRVEKRPTTEARRRGSKEAGKTGSKKGTGAKARAKEPENVPIEFESFVERTGVTEKINRRVYLLILDGSCGGCHQKIDEKGVNWQHCETISGVPVSRNEGSEAPFSHFGTGRVMSMAGLNYVPPGGRYHKIIILSIAMSGY
ncbi:MAG TPA: hypothetical protein VMF66_04375 [Candidatus Acidoferrum sp.]|nr:hypothetical protein [Candidatus Acidoferrum sp.]